MADRSPILRDYQRDVIARVEAEVAAGRRRILLVAPTGSGKTVIAAAIIASTIKARKRALFLAHRRELIVQASAKLHAVGCDHGVLLPGYPARHYEPVQVASIATLHARAIRSRSIEPPPADLVVVDEAHHTLARTYARALDLYPRAVVVGLTATPCRGDGRGLGGAFQSLVECPSVAELIQLGHLVPTRVFAPSRPDLTGIKVQRGGDYAESQLAERMNTRRLVGDVVEHWLRLAEHRRTVVFATGVSHSLHIRDEFCRAGVLAEHVDGSTPIEERDAILRRLEAGKTDLVCNAMVLTEGWDAPTISCIVLARPTKSLGLYRQMVGRVLRPAPGKTDALVLDHAGATFAHGFAEDPIEWALEDDRRAQNARHAARGNAQHAPALTVCPECSAVRFEGQPCGSCGWRPHRKARPVAVADGELGHVERDRTVRPVDRSAQEKDKVYRELLWIAREKNHKTGWAAHKYKEKFGAWPAAKPWDLPDPEPPTQSTRSWVRSRDIAYAREMAAQR